MFELALPVTAAGGLAKREDVGIKALGMTIEGERRLAPARDRPGSRRGR